MTHNKNPHLVENFAEAQSTTIYVPPPKTGIANISVRVGLEMTESLNALMYARDRDGNLFFNPALYKSLSDVIRVVLYQGYLAVAKIVEEEGVSTESRALVAVQRAASEAHTLDMLEATVNKTSESLSRYLAAGAVDEARALWNRQMENTHSMKGHWKKTMLQVLDKYKAACERPAATAAPKKLKLAKKKATE